jgi:hypothetical protein
VFVSDIRYAFSRLIKEEEGKKKKRETRRRKRFRHLLKCGRVPRSKAPPRSRAIFKKKKEVRKKGGVGKSCKFGKIIKKESLVPIVSLSFCFRRSRRRRRRLLLCRQKKKKEETSSLAGKLCVSPFVVLRWVGIKVHRGPFIHHKGVCGNSRATGLYYKPRRNILVGWGKGGGNVILVLFLGRRRRRRRLINAAAAITNYAKLVGWGVGGAGAPISFV